MNLLNFYNIVKYTNCFRLQQNKGCSLCNKIYNAHIFCYCVYCYFRETAVGYSTASATTSVQLLILDMVAPGRHQFCMQSYINLCKRGFARRIVITSAKCTITKRYCMLLVNFNNLYSRTFTLYRVIKVL